MNRAQRRLHRRVWWLLLVLLPAALLEGERLAPEDPAAAEAP